MTVAGQPTLNYCWDSANRLTGISQQSCPTNPTVGFTYDNADRRQTLTLPNGIVLTYTYDNDSHVTAMTWTLASNTVGNLQYQYDADGRVTQKTGTFAQGQLPSAVSNNQFNAANEMTSFNGTALSYDTNGNLANDGTNTYSWDARNHLVGITGGNTASFAYDADGRRSLKSINGTSTQLLYDGLNPVQELQNGAPSANMLTGLGIDEYFQRTDSAGARDYLTDILSSSLALTDSTGTIQTQYSYDPFGKSASSGSASANPYQFTGRENDGTGLDFYRARYYSPANQRFVAQDPIGFRGGDVNLYAYADNSPVDWDDPFGLLVQICTKFWHPHTFLCDDGNCSGKYPSGNPFWSPGEILDDSPKKSSAYCADVPTRSSDPQCFDKCVAKEISNRGPSGDHYNFEFANCGQWAEDVIDQCLAQCAKE